MQSDWKRVYKLTSERTTESEQTYKDLGNFVFATLYSHLQRPKSIITKLKGVGTWYLRRKRMQMMVDLHADDDLDLYKYESRKEIHEIFKKRLQEYEQYVKERDEIRKIRYGTQTLLQPVKRED